ncbi:MAG: glycoside hydrolase family 43 protein, partial [Bdellovibrionota bacterium]
IISRLLLLFAFLIPSAWSSSSFNEELALDMDFPDPSIMLADDGWYYAYATQTMLDGEFLNLKSNLDPKSARPVLVNIQLAKSQDLKNWKYVGEAMPDRPPWAFTTQKIWAPHVVKLGQQYVMYYSALQDFTDQFCIAVATSSNPAGPFVDMGKPLVCGNSFENIDPVYFKDPLSKKSYLYWGSGFAPIRAQELSNDGLSFAVGSMPINLLYPRSVGPEPNYQRLVEAAWVTYNEGYYYLFFSGANCCDPNPSYAVMVARSRNALGPFEISGRADRTYGVILSESARFTAMGHNAVITDKDGIQWLFFHGIDRSKPYLKHAIPGDRNVRRVFLRARLGWKNLWPVAL